jgi:hypothetical protein
MYEKTVFCITFAVSARTKVSALAKEESLNPLGKKRPGGARKQQRGRRGEEEGAGNVGMCIGGGLEEGDRGGGRKGRASLMTSVT